MSDLQNEIIGFVLIAIAVIVFAYYKQRIEDKDK
jgi:cbb3-type cytochrome oxidase subunit 3|tara:strand:+ start:1633 stop:1734 length:102 start_codon:yes stop_codon:yes gene_type:complete